MSTIISKIKNKPLNSQTREMVMRVHHHMADEAKNFAKLSYEINQLSELMPHLKEIIEILPHLKQIVSSPSNSEVIADVIPHIKAVSELLPQLKLVTDFPDKLKELALFLSHFQPVLKRVSKATFVSERTVSQILKESKQIQNSGRPSSFTSPKKKINRKKPKTDVDDFTRSAIRRTIHDFHKMQGRFPTLKTLLPKVIDNNVGFSGSINSLSRILSTIGFQYLKTEDRRQILIEKHEIRVKRLMFLKAVKKFRDEGRSIVYTHEAYIYSCSDKVVKGLKMPIGKGERLIVVNAGGLDGFIPNALSIFKSSQKTGDSYHDMNFENYLKWVSEKLIPNLQNRSVVVLDNAKYHAVEDEMTPTSQSKKKDLQDWLMARNIFFPNDALKPELYQLVQQNKPRYKKFKIDQQLVSNGHTVLRLPPCHPDLSPIENIWCLLKDNVTDINVAFTLEAARRFLEEKVALLTSEHWNNVCQHVAVNEDAYMQSDQVIDILTENLTFIVNNDSTSEEDDDLLNVDDKKIKTEIESLDDMGDIEYYPMADPLDDI